MHIAGNYVLCYSSGSVMNVDRFIAGPEMGSSIHSKLVGSNLAGCSCVYNSWCQLRTAEHCQAGVKCLGGCNVHGAKEGLR